MSELGEFILGVDLLGGEVSDQWIETLLGQLIGDASGATVWWEFRPQASEPNPLVILQKSGETRDYHLGGDSNFCYYRFDAYVFGYTFLTVLEIADAIKSALSGLSGNYGTRTIMEIELESEDDLPRQPKTGGEQYLNCRLQSWSVMISDEI